MKIRADEHVSPEIVDAVRRIILTPAFAFDHVYDAGQKGMSDEHWITKFAKAGGNAILTADTDFIHKHPQVLAVFNTGMKVIHMPKKWGMAGGYLQASHILAWWPRIEAKLGEMKQRECFQPEWNVSGETGLFKKVDIDFAKAHKKAKA
ncbi:DUF5615 family PIN-like protein [Mesorhizobium sp. RSR380A]|uniref:DUF5615 family PIN-like protein n=1 Tax=unclassified Mesorhizobium TaxID=325217 RepID=UPI0003CE9C86|nr:MULTISPECIES: DUF5615 family PIN-like protein [unclassified Mesorhizobium]ESX47251.1 hypothetical protein X762_19645 [Mesorhizobium sp. LSHC426A00]ESX56697.1 hypothetical protein X761_10700 [Mesorhizobium sp. LSHC424B00]ESX71500.1 hypothetical protein X758_15090 [Mesorhizobium sp. LSHC416B00]ESY48879.1 hypothetical protein X746_07825 [Mesorhizobium sp. LNJC380A00]WJI61364.1 DUF5615 family PIN-like protein [Mesorhizobium sp. C416B]